ncbi:transposase [Sphingomonas sp. T1]|uniref:transposase n=1 Tax=Sphingomonas sp. T1 TaxID=2653172 RepID=UPI001F2596A2|nr:transposase [Sphingomonas sp. T1]
MLPTLGSASTRPARCDRAAGGGDPHNAWQLPVDGAPVRTNAAHHAPQSGRDSHCAGFEDPAPRSTVTAELNKGEARNSLVRAVAFHRLGRFRNRGPENIQTRAAALNLVTAAIILSNCPYLGRAVDEMRRRGTPVDPAMLSRLSPLG